MNPTSDPLDAAIMNRREAIKRTALMLGVAISPTLLAGVMQAQPTAAGATGKPAYLDAKQFETAAAIAERILPRTDTPGARDVGVPAFIDLMYGKYLSDDEKGAFNRGLAEVEAESVRANRRSFAQLSPSEQDSQLRRIAAAQKQEKSFFHQMRELTLLGYFTSEPVGKNVLHFDPIPGRYDGCVPLAEVGNVAWTVK